LRRIFSEGQQLLNLKNPIILAITVILTGSCGKVYNSSSADQAKYGSAVLGSANFLAARAVMASQCFSCHSNWANFDEAAFVSGGFVVPQSLPGSKLYTRIRGNSVNSTGNMPPSGVLTSQQVDTFSTWISGM
jgi:uncharacterized membrane protein